MRGRLTWLLFGVVFSVTLALIVGQRLSAESMAVVIGVIAGVAASIPGFTYNSVGCAPYLLR